jgi:hypothetical protein
MKSLGLAGEAMRLLVVARGIAEQDCYLKHEMMLVYAQ